MIGTMCAMRSTWHANGVSGNNGYMDAKVCRCGCPIGWVYLDLEGGGEGWSPALAGFIKTQEWTNTTKYLHAPIFFLFQQLNTCTHSFHHIMHA